MAKWDKELEGLILKLGEYVDIQMKILLDTKIGAKKSATKIVFNFTAKGNPLMKKTCKKLNLTFKNNWKDNLKKIVYIAEENNSLAAEKIKRAIPLISRLDNIFKDSSGGFFAKVKLAKKQKFRRS